MPLMSSFTRLCIFISLIFTMTIHASNYTQENNFEQTLPAINSFWKQGEFSTFEGVNNIRINYASFTRNENKECLIIVPGRTEGYLKYQELAFDLFNQGYNLFIIDHRGQGISGRMLQNPHKGYVDSFEHYVDDLNHFVDNVVTPACNSQNKPFLLAHSMGGNISALYLTKYSEKIQAAVLASPMIGINTGGLPVWLGRSIINTRVWWDNSFNDESNYFIGQGDYSNYPYEDNALTQSRIRFEFFKNTYDVTPELQLGGVTNMWLKQALIARDTIFSTLNNITTPVTVLQSGADTVVDNLDQFEFCEQLHKAQPQSCLNGKPQVFDGAYHELFFEVDEIRNPAIDAVIGWFNQHRNNH